MKRARAAPPRDLHKEREKAREKQSICGMKRAPPKDLPEATAEAETLTFSLSARVVVEGSDFLLMATVYPSDMPPILARLEPSCEYMYKASLLCLVPYSFRI